MPLLFWICYENYALTGFFAHNSLPLDAKFPLFRAFPCQVWRQLLSLYIICFRGDVDIFMILLWMESAGWEVEGFVLKAKGRDQVIKKCNTVSWCDEFSASRITGAAGIGVEASKTTHPNSPKAGHFSYRPATMPCRGPCWGILYIHIHI